MSLSKYPSAVSLPRLSKPYPTILEFLVERFPRVGQSVWEVRIQAGKVLNEAGRPITFATPFLPQQKLFYFREVAAEPLIPLQEKILFQNAEILVACKPPFLPVIPSGTYVDECLLNRLKAQTGNRDLVPLHRIDRETSGLVLFSLNKATRGRYGELFENGRIEKSYEAVAEVQKLPEQQEWTVENRLVEGKPWFRMQQVPGEVNARSRIKLVEVRNNRGLFELGPITGKKHQLRVHMCGLGFRILNDRYYPELLPRQADDLDHPLQLLARRLKFIDPVSGREMEFESERRLVL
jgi:tRNA pseudouridine32 synthase / 23S rRNA pseudouridine746 synthase